MGRSYLIGTICLFLGLLLTGCGRPMPAATQQPAATVLPAAPTSAPTSASPGNTPIPPTATAAPTATPTPEPTPTPDFSLPGDWVAFADSAQGLRIYHPAQWDVSRPTTEKLAQFFAQTTGNEGEYVQSTLRQLTETPGALDAFAVLGLLFDDPTSADHKFLGNFTGIVVPAEGLTLDSYMALVGGQLTDLEAVTLENAQIKNGLRPGGLDVASLRYTIDGATLYGLADGMQIDGWQVALYDASGERLLVLSLTGATANFPVLEEMFQRLIYNIEFE